MRRSILSLLPLALASCLSAGEAALALLTPDAQRLQRRLAEGPLATVLGQEAWRAWVASTAGGGAAEVRAVLAGATQVRLELDRLGRPGGLPAGQLVIGAVAGGDLASPTLPTGLHLQRAGAWVLLGGLDGQLRQPRAAAVPDQWPGADLIGAIHLPAWTALLPAGQRAGLGRLWREWNLGQVTWQVDLAQRREQLRAPGAVTPLRPIAPAALLGLPESPDLVLACGVSGEALAALAEPAVQAAGLDREGTELWAQQHLGAPVADLLAACAGTVWLAVVGQPRQIVVSLPQHPLLVEALQQWILAAQPEPGPAADELATALVASAREGALPLAWPGGVFVVRLAHERIFLANASRLLDGLTVDEQPAPAAAAADWSPQACLRVQWGPRAWGLLAPGPAPATPWGQLRGIVAASELPAGWIEARQEPDSLRVDSQGPLTLLAAGLTALPGLLPGWLDAYAARCAAQHQATMQELIGRARAFAAATNDKWPRDFADLRTWARDLTDEQVAAAGRPDLATPFIYVHPIFGAPGDQPVLVQDPVLHAGRGSLVGFVDGRVEFRAGLLHWTEAKRLAALPEVVERGAAPAQWATMPRVF